MLAFNESRNPCKLLSISEQLFSQRPMTIRQQPISLLLEVVGMANVVFGERDQIAMKLQPLALSVA